MPLRSNQTGNRRPFRARVGLDFEEWLGIRKEGDPSSNKPNQPRHLVNARLVSGEIECRGGQSLITSSALDGCITGIFAPEFQFEDIPRTLFHGGTNTGIASGRGVIWKWSHGDSTLTYYDTGLSAVIDDIAVYDSNTIFGTVRIGGDTRLYEFKLEPSTDNGDSRAVASATLRGSITSGTVESSSCCLLGTDVYVAHGTAVDTDAKVYKWNGATFSSVDSPGIAHELLIRPTHASGLLVLRASNIPGSDSNNVRVMTSAGSWSSITAQNNYRAFDVEIFGGATWIGGQTSADTHTVSLMLFDGSAYTTALELSAGAVSPETVERDLKLTLAVAQQKIWFIRGRSNGSTQALLGNYDGTTFDEDFLSFTTTGQTVNFTEAHGLALVDDSLVAIVDIGGIHNIISSPGSDLDGVWVSFVSDTLDSAETTTDPERLASKAGV